MPVNSKAGHLRIGRFSEHGRIYIIRCGMRVGCEFLTTASQPNAGCASCYKDCGVRKSCSSCRRLRSAAQQS